MFLSLCYMVFGWVLQLATLRLRSNDCKELEIVVLRHELAILRRGTRRPAMTWSQCAACGERGRVYNRLAPRRFEFVPLNRAANLFRDRNPVSFPNLLQSLEKF